MMGNLRDAIAAKTLGAANAIDLNNDILADLSWSPMVKGSAVILMHKAHYGYVRWKDAGHTSREYCAPGDWIIIDGTNILFKTQTQVDAAGYGTLAAPDLSLVVFL